MDEGYLRTLHENHEDWLHRGVADQAGLIHTTSRERKEGGVCCNACVVCRATPPTPTNALPHALPSPTPTPRPRARAELTHVSQLGTEDLQRLESAVGGLARQGARLSVGALPAEDHLPEPASIRGQVRRPFVCVHVPVCAYARLRARARGRVAGARPRSLPSPTPPPPPAPRRQVVLLSGPPTTVTLPGNFLSGVPALVMDHDRDIDIHRDVEARLHYAKQVRCPWHACLLSLSLSFLLLCRIDVQVDSGCGGAPALRQAGEGAPPHSKTAASPCLRCSLPPCARLSTPRSARACAPPRACPAHPPSHPTHPHAQVSDFFTYVQARKAKEEEALRAAGGDPMRMAVDTILDQISTNVARGDKAPLPPHPLCTRARPRTQLSDSLRLAAPSTPHPRHHASHPPTLPKPTTLPTPPRSPPPAHAQRSDLRHDPQLEGQLRSMLTSLGMPHTDEDIRGVVTGRRAHAGAGAHR